MNTPSIEIRWGGKKWNGGLRRATKPYVESALGLAQDGIEDLDIPLNGTKAATILRSDRKNEVLGRSYDATSFCLYLHPVDLKRYKVESAIPELTVTAFHELMHCVRYETFDTDALLEVAVSEGLAYAAENIFAQSLLPPDEVPGVSDILIDHVSRGRAPQYADMMCEDAQLEEAMPSLHEVVNTRWFHDVDGNVPAGIVAGVVAVQHLLDQGVDFPTMLTMPPETVIRSIL